LTMPSMDKSLNASAFLQLLSVRCWGLKAS
jgi:hypothetical protein